MKIFFSLRGYQIFSLRVEIFPCHNTKGEISQSVRFFYFEISSEIENENCEKKNNKNIKKKIIFTIHYELYPGVFLNYSCLKGLYRKTHNYTEQLYSPPNVFFGDSSESVDLLS